jgi:hypothetical protein
MIDHLEVDSLRLAQMRLDYANTWVFFFFYLSAFFFFFNWFFFYSSIE